MCTEMLLCEWQADSYAEHVAKNCITEICRLLVNE